MRPRVRRAPAHVGRPPGEDADVCLSQRRTPAAHRSTHHDPATVVEQEARVWYGSRNSTFRTVFQGTKVVAHGAVLGHTVVVDDDTAPQAPRHQQRGEDHGAREGDPTDDRPLLAVAGPRTHAEEPGHEQHADRHADVPPPVAEPHRHRSRWRQSCRITAPTTTSPSSPPNSENTPAVFSLRTSVSWSMRAGAVTEIRVANVRSVVDDRDRALFLVVTPVIAGAVDPDRHGAGPVQAQQCLDPRRVLRVPFPVGVFLDPDIGDHRVAASLAGGALRVPIALLDRRGPRSAPRRRLRPHWRRMRCAPPPSVEVLLDVHPMIPAGEPVGLTCVGEGRRSRRCPAFELERLALAATNEGARLLGQTLDLPHQFPRRKPGDEQPPPRRPRAVQVTPRRSAVDREHHCPGDRPGAQPQLGYHRVAGVGPDHQDREHGRERCRLRVSRRVVHWSCCTRPVRPLHPPCRDRNEQFAPVHRLASKFDLSSGLAPVAGHWYESRRGHPGRAGMSSPIEWLMDRELLRQFPQRYGAPSTSATTTRAHRTVRSRRHRRRHVRTAGGCRVPGDDGLATRHRGHQHARARRSAHRPRARRRHRAPRHLRRGVPGARRQRRRHRSPWGCATSTTWCVATGAWCIHHRVARMVFMDASRSSCQ